MKKTLISLLILAMGLHAEDVYATFTVHAKQSANLAFGANGTIDTIHVHIGDNVHKGDTLAALQSDDIRAAVRIAELSETYAKKDYDRLQSVKEVTDQVKLDGVSFKYQSAQAAHAYKQALMDKTILKAPFDGTITARTLEVGDSFTALRPVPVCHIQSTHARKLILSFDQKYWKAVQPGQTFSYTIDGDSTAHTGTIAKVYPTANPQSRKMQAEVYAADLPVGLFGEGKILLPKIAE